MMNVALRILCFGAALTASWAAAVPSGMDGSQSAAVGHNTVPAGDDLLEGIYNDCADKGSVSCVKYKLFAYVDRALNKDEINLTEGVTVVRTSGGGPGADGGAPRALRLENGDDYHPAEGKPKDIDALVVGRVRRFLEEHSIKVDIKGSDIVDAVARTGKSIQDAVGRFVGDDDDDDDTNVEESRGKKSELPCIIVFRTMACYCLPI